MKKFTLKIIMMLFTITIALVPLNLLYHSTNRYVNEHYEISKFLNVPSSIEFANFGSSHGQLGFYYEENEMNSFNFALSSQTPEYDLMLLKEYIDHFEEGSTLVFPISYFTPYLFPRRHDFEFEVRNKRYYHILSPKNIIEFDVFEQISEKASFLNGRDLINIGAIQHDDLILDELMLSQGNFPLKEWDFGGVKSKLDLQNDAYVRWEYWTQFRANIYMNQTGTVSKEIIETYQNIIDICKANNLNPVFVTLPVSSELNNVVDPIFYPIFVKDMQQMINELGSPIYFDYSHLKPISSNDSYFIDTDHLSKVGAMRMTEIIKQDLKILNEN